MDECSPALCASAVIDTTHLDSIAIGVMASDLEIIATVSPGASRSRRGWVAFEETRNLDLVIDRNVKRLGSNSMDWERKYINIQDCNWRG